jgi:hypothetical protein
MGILDEAIKEHLDLKRRRGADPTEVERLEREALGPVRRAPQEAADDMFDHEAAAGVAYPDEEAGHERAEPLEEEPPAEEQLHEEPLPEEPLLEREPEYEAPRHHEIAEEWHAHESLHAEQTGETENVHEPVAAEGRGLEPDAPPAPAVSPAPASPPPSESRPPVPPPDQPEHLGEETAEYDVEAEHRGERQGDGEDVLEETPEFLQDTPDHDRLWFEQRPPKDFDFDK